MMPKDSLSMPSMSGINLIDSCQHLLDAYGTDRANIGRSELRFSVKRFRANAMDVVITEQKFSSQIGPGPNDCTV